MPSSLLVHLTNTHSHMLPPVISYSHTDLQQSEKTASVTSSLSWFTFIYCLHKKINPQHTVRPGQRGLIYGDSRLIRRPDVKPVILHLQLNRADGRGKRGNDQHLALFKNWQSCSAVSRFISIQMIWYVCQAGKWPSHYPAEVSLMPLRVCPCVVPVLHVLP